MLQRTLLALAFAALAATASAAVYKWVDEKGVTQYSSEPPPNQKAKEIKVQGGNTFSAPKSGNVDAESKQLANEMAEGLMKVKPSGTLDCAKAVENSRYSLDQMLETGRRNLKGGHIKQADFDKTAPLLTKARGRVSESECRSSSGKTKDFYTCMSSGYNLALACMKEHDYH
ncbi:MAG TPA: DUF4124 domain-containing protein [Chitinolyticbacter sp.]|nr:DUF4124 domain-containing protein [Chitinolyticbacter sp.]